MLMEEYEQLLDDGIKALPQVAATTERFEIPKAKGHIQGNKTVITNFNQIVDFFRRDRNHFLKFLLKELATPGTFDGARLVIGRKLSSSLINQKIEQYANTFVLCSNCGKPDTQVIEKENTISLKCAACGTQKLIKQ